METEPFLESEQGKIIARAKQFLSSADILMRSPEYAGRPSLLFAPILHLSAHGIELLLKFPHFRAGVPEKSIRKSYGHDLMKLWSDSRCHPIRNLVGKSAQIAWAEARDSGRWPDNFFEDPIILIDSFLMRLAELHGTDTNYGLRYILPDNAQGPRPWLLVETFLDVTDRVLKNPGLIDPSDDHMIGG